MPRFKPGQSGNPGGRPKEEVHVRELARQHGPAAIQALVNALGDPRTRVAAAAALLDRGYGRPAQTVAMASLDEKRCATDWTRGELIAFLNGPDTVGDSSKLEGASGRDARPSRSRAD